MRNLITGSERPALAAESGAASVSRGVSEWGLVWVSLSHFQLPWQLGSMLACQSRWPLESMLAWKLGLQSKWA